MHLKLRIQSIIPLFFLLAALCDLAAPVAADAFLSGTAELEYIKYDSELNGAKQLTADSFRQNYSLVYNTAGKFMGGRFGAYKGMLGYEWGSFDTKLVTPSETLNPSISASNFLYSGELLMDPKELPLRLRLYSRDTVRTNFLNDTLSTTSGDQLIKPMLPTDVVNTGTNVESGATLRLGVKNGMTNGYNAIFRHVPLLLLDYSDIVRKDDKAQSRVDTRLRRLAFISLNKKDNWFHYRVSKFTDNITPAANYSESQVQLGTVDEMLSRRWIDFTNWIKLSTDIQFSRRVDNGRLPAETYDANLFLIATRAKWELRNFNTFSRHFDHGSKSLRMERNIPMYLSGIWGQEADWSVRVVSEESLNRSSSSAAVTTRDLLTSYRINAFNRSRFNLSHTGNAEHYTSKGIKTLVLAGTLQTSSTRKFSDAYRIAASYDVKRFDTESQSVGRATMAHDLSASVTYQPPSRRFMLALSEQVSVVDGVSATNEQTTIYASSSTADSTSISRAQSTSLGYKRIRTMLKGDWTPKERLQAGGSVTQEMFVEEGKDTEQSLTAQAYARYKRDRLTAGVSTTYTDRSSSEHDNTELQASADVAYFASRDMNFGFRGTYSNTSSLSSSTTNIDFTQDFAYRRMAGVGASRRLLEVTELFTYNRTAVSSGTPLSRKKLTLGLSYYPWSFLSISNRATYGWNDPDSQTELVYNGSISLSYPKLHASLDYSYGTRDAKNDRRKESRLAANLKKFF